jgi:hypothetical protein
MTSQSEDATVGTQWEAIQRSPLFAVYIWELYWLAANVARLAETVFAATPVGVDDGTDLIKGDAEIHGRLSAILGEAAKIRTLINGRPKRRDQSAAAYAIQTKRAQALRQLLDGISLETVLSAHVRHSLEHFDERLDRAALALVDGTAQLPVNIPFNIVLSRRRALLTLRGTTVPKSRLFPLRVYIANERVFINAGDEVNVGKLYDECGAIRERLRPLVPEAPGDERGSFVVVLTEESFARC